MLGYITRIRADEQKLTGLKVLRKVLQTPLHIDNVLCCVDNIVTISIHVACQLSVCALQWDVKKSCPLVMFHFLFFIFD